MNALFVFVVLSASAVLSSPVPTRIDDRAGANPIDVYNDNLKKHFPELTIFSQPQPFGDDFFNKDTRDVFDDFQPKFPPSIVWPKIFSDDIFKHLDHNLKDLKDLKNDTVENVKEVDGHIVHEKERTYSSGDKDHHFAFRQKTVIVRPKNDVDKNPITGKPGDEAAGQPVDAGKTSVETSAPYPTNRGVQRPATSAAGNPTNGNPDEDVEMINVSRNDKQNGSDLFA